MDETDLVKRPRRLRVITLKRILLLGGAVALAALAYACTMRDITGVAVGEVVVSPSSATLLEGGTIRFTAQARDVKGNPLPVGNVGWSSDAPSLVSVGSDGTAEALQPGQTTIWATLEGVRGSASVTVQPAPAIAVAPQSISLWAPAGESVSEPVVLQITNAGAGTLTGLSASVEYAQGGATGWLGLSLAGTTAPTTLSVSALTASLSVGIHRATVQVTAQGAKNSPISIPVEVEISLDKPIISLSPTTLAFEVERDGPAPSPGTVQVTNSGPGTLSGLQILVPADAVGWLSASLSSSTAPAQLQVQINPAGLAVGTYEASVLVRSTLAGVQSQSVDVILTVVPPPLADLGVTKSGSATAFVGDTVLFVLTLTNAGPEHGRETMLVDSLPQELAFLQASGGGTASGQVVTWSLGDFPANTTRVDSIWARVQSPGALLNVARVSSTSDDPRPGNNRATHALEAKAITANLRVTKSGPIQAELQDTLVYILRVRNEGPSPAEDVVLIDSLPSGTSFLSATGGGTSEGTRVVWDLGTLDVGALVVDTLSVVVMSTGLLGNVVVASASTPDPSPGTRRATLTTAVNIQADLSLTKTGPTSVQSGDTVEYVLTVSNAGPDTSERINIVDSLPPGMTFLSASDEGTLQSPEVVSWNLPGIEPDESAEVRLHAAADLIGTATNVAWLFSEAIEPDSIKQRASQTLEAVGADLSIIKRAEVEEGTTSERSITYTIEVSSSHAAEGVVVIDTLPVGVRFESASDGGALDSEVDPNGVVIWELGTLTPAQSPRALQLKVTLDADKEEAIANVVAVTATTGDPNRANNRATVTTVLGAASDVGVEKTGPGTAAPGTDVTYSLRVFNAGPKTASEVSVLDTLPEGVAFVSASAGGSFDPDAGANGVVRWESIPTLAENTDTTFTLIVRVPLGATGEIRNVATVTSLSADPNPDNNSSESLTSLAASSDLVLFKAGPGGALPGDRIAYTITINNRGPNDAESVVVTDSLPPEVSLVSADPPVSSQVGRVISWEVGTVTVAAEPQSFSLTVDIDPTTSATITNTAQVSAATKDPAPGNNRSAVNTSVTGANLGVAKSVADTGGNPDQVIAGATAVYTITVHNAGPSEAEDVVVTDTLPQGVTFASASGGGSLDPDAGPNGVVTWPAVSVISKDAQEEFTLTVVVASDRTDDLVNVAAVTSATADTDPTNNVVTLSSPVEISADVGVMKTAPKIALPDERIEYELTVRNLGPSLAMGAVLTDTLPVGVTYVSHDGNGQYASGEGPNGVITWDLGSLIRDEPETFRISVVVDMTTAGTVTNVGAVTSTTPDPDAENAWTATATIIVPAAPSDLSATVVSQTVIDLAWTDNATNETGYRVERSPDGTTNWTAVATLAANATSYSDTGLTANTTYYYRVFAFNTGGDSAPSNTANATTLPNPPAAPSNLSATAVSQSVIDLAWTDNATSETGYRVERSPDGTTNWTTVATLDPNATSYSDTGLTASTTYHYRVFAFNTGGDSAPSNTANATTLPDPEGESAEAVRRVSAPLPTPTPDA